VVFLLFLIEYLQYEGDKFSKSRGTGVFGDHVAQTDVPIAVWRYVLLANRPETSDSQFSFSDMVNRVNGELLANLGNLINRALKFCQSKFKAEIPEFIETPLEKAAITDINKLITIYIENMERSKFRAGLQTAMDIAHRGNLYLTEVKLDNTLPTEKAGTAVNFVLNIGYLLSALLNPFIPTTSDTICEYLNVPECLIPDSFCLQIGAGHQIQEQTGYLFKRMEAAEGKSLYMRFGGEAVEAAKAAAKAEKKANEARKKAARAAKRAEEEAASKAKDGADKIEA